MQKSFELQVRGVTEEKQRAHADGRKIFRAVATTPALDRYGEVVLPKGALLDNFIGKNANPVLLEIHNFQKTSIGQVLAVEVTEKEMTFDFVFSTSTRGAEMQAQYEAGDMRAFSIGFKPKAQVDLWSWWDDEPDVKEITVSYPDGSEGVVDLRGYEKVPYTVYNKWELLEISCVPVPANPEALLLNATTALMREAEEIVRRAGSYSPVMRSFVQEDMKGIAPVMRQLAQFLGKYESGELGVTGRVAPHETVVEDSPEKLAAAKVALARWASSDGRGQKDTINWAKYSKGFLSFDVEKADVLSHYKFLHHTVKDGTLVAVWRMVTAAMAATLSAQETMSAEDVQADYDHLAAHYRAAGHEPPALKAYTEDELKAIEEQPFTIDKAEGEVAQPATSSGVEGEAVTASDAPEAAELFSTAKATLDLVKSLSAKMATLETEVGAAIVELNICVANLLDEMGSKPQKKSIEKSVQKEVLPPAEDQTKAFEVAESTLTDLEKFVAGVR